MKNKPTITRDLIRSFGRVNGRKLRTGQQHLIDNLLPQYAVNMENPLGGINASTWLEIGFGYGEHLVGLAMRYPDVYFIGCEPFINGVATMLKQIDDNKVENIRIFHGDARLLIEKLPSASVDRLFILFPDPWPKSKHHKKRIITKESLKDFARIIKIGGKLDIATDHAHYGKWIEEHFAESFEFVANKILGIDSIPEDWVETRYQLKAREQGRGARFFNLLRVG